MQEPRDAASATRDMTRSPKVLVQTGDVRIVEYTLKPGDSHPWHHHTEVTDRVYCLQGLIAVDIRQPAERRVLRPGDSSEVAPRTVHHVSNAGDGTSRYLLQALGKYDYIRAD